MICNNFTNLTYVSMQAPKLNYLLEMELLFLHVILLRQVQTNIFENWNFHTEQAYRTSLSTVSEHVASVCLWIIPLKKTKQSLPSRVSPLTIKGSIGMSVSI